MLTLNCGFSNSAVSFPRRDKSGTKIGDIQAATITADELRTGLHFYPPGSAGINLLKIHGALDVFTFRNGEDLAKLLPSSATVETIIETLRIANEELVYAHRQLSRPVKTTNEITYADDAGEMQFLRRSLLAGAHKFDNRRSQVLPEQMLGHFRRNINFVSSLVCIGYGFGDIHINQIIGDWLEFSAGRHLEIVRPSRPGIDAVLPFLLHLAAQVNPIDSAATDYLDRATGTVRSRRENLERSLGEWIRKSPDKGEAQEAFSIFLR